MTTRPTLVPTRGPLPPRAHLYRVLLRNFWAACAIVAGSLSIGAVGYHAFEGMGWIDAYYAAAMILTSMGPSTELRHDGAKVFAIFYALFSAGVFLTVITLMLAPVVHRFLHRFHLEVQEDQKKRQ